MGMIHEAGSVGWVRAALRGWLSVLLVAVLGFVAETYAGTPRLAASPIGGTSFAVAGDGVLYGWGFDQHGQLGIGRTFDRLLPGPVFDGSDFTKIAAEGAHVLGLKSDGSLWAWGDNTW